MKKTKKTASKKSLNSCDKLIVTLFARDMKEARKEVKLLLPKIKTFEIGLPTYTALGPSVVKMVKDAGGKVFLDLKYHDIPSTVASAVESATDLGVDMLTVHAEGGAEMMRRAVEAADSAAKKKSDRPKIFGVTVLTSFESLADIGIQYEIREQVVRLAKLAKQSGLDGVIASPLEIKRIRSACGDKFSIVTSGVRPAGSAALDQRRIASPAMAISAGADYIIVGRPVFDAKDPLGVVEKIIEEMDVC